MLQQQTNIHQQTLLSAHSFAKIFPISLIFSLAFLIICRHSMSVPLTYVTHNRRNVKYLLTLLEHLDQMEGNIFFNVSATLQVYILSMFSSDWTALTNDNIVNSLINWYPLQTFSVASSFPSDAIPVSRWVKITPCVNLSKQTLILCLL